MMRQAPDDSLDQVAASGRRIHLPAARLETVEQAPPGLTIQMLQVPDTRVETVEQAPPGAGFEPADAGR